VLKRFTTNASLHQLLERRANLGRDFLALVGMRK
jgi:hypothetical protein